MYTGTLIRDLTVTVERVEERSRQQLVADERELHEIFAMQIASPGGQVFMGAA